jgi:hypothetical protein
MALQPWVSNTFIPLNMTGIQGFPHDLPKDVGRWIPKFSNHSVISAKGHLTSFYDALGLHNVHEHEDVIMRLLSSSLIGYARQWYNNLPSKSIKTWETFENAFLKRWRSRKMVNFSYPNFTTFEESEKNQSTNSMQGLMH